MAITLADFTKIWASTSPLTPYSFSDSNYQEGWNFIGATPPARQMWDSIQKNNDEKLKYIVDNFLPLSGGTMTGGITVNYADFIKRSVNDDHLTIMGGTAYSNSASLYLTGGSAASNGGSFQLKAQNGTNSKDFIGKPDGTLTWAGKNVLTNATVGTILEASTSADVSLSASAAKNITSLTIPKGTWIITGHARFDSVTSGNAYGAMFGGTSASYNSNNDSAIYVHSSSTSPISIQTTRIIVQNANGTVYFVGYANAACKVLSGATFRAIRIL